MAGDKLQLKSVSVYMRIYYLDIYSNFKEKNKIYTNTYLNGKIFAPGARHCNSRRKKEKQTVVSLGPYSTIQCKFFP